MDFLLSEDLREYRDVLRKYFSSVLALKTPVESALTLEDAQGHWQTLAELGVLAAVIPEEYDGLGFGLAAGQIALEQSGWELCALPLFETIALGIVPLICLASKEQCALRLPKIAAGSLTLTGTLLFDSEHESFPDVTLEKGPKKGVWAASGELNLVPSALETDAILFSAPHPAETNRFCLCLMDRTEIGASVVAEHVPVLDLLRRFYRLKLNAAPVTVLSDTVTRSSLSFVRELVAVLACGELLGGAGRIHADTVEYVTTRKQFGKAIGSFQAIQHTLAEGHLALEQLLSMARYVGSEVLLSDLENEASRRSMTAFRSLATERIPILIEEALQAHGGIGFTWEYHLHLFLRRARMMSLVAGGSEKGYQALAESLIQST